MGETTYPHPYGAYVLLEHLGRGGMANVDLARRTVDDAQFVRFVVIKRIQTHLADDPNFVRMFTDEARISAELQQEHIAQVYDFGQQGDEYFLAMEYVPGVNLRHVQRLVAGRGVVPPFRIAFRILADVLSALQYAHARVDTYGRPMHLVHRDVNPRNVMLSVRGEVKLIDFGVAKADTRAEHTVGKSMKGKFAYMAPEQIEGTAPVDGRADLFSMGMMLHELIEGRSPYAGLTEAQIMHRTVSGPIPEIKVPTMYPDAEFLRGVHRRALAKSPNDRYPDAGAFRADIVEAAEKVGGLASREEMSEFLRKVTPDDVSRITERLKVYRQISPAERPDKTDKFERVQPPAPPENDPTPSPAERTAVPPERSTASVLPRPVAPKGLDRRLIAVALLSMGVVFLVGLIASKVAEPPPEPIPSTQMIPPAVEKPASPPVEALKPPEPAPAEPAPAETTPGVPTRPHSRSGQNTAASAVALAPQVPAAADGFLNITSRPQVGYNVLLDGNAVGVTPMKAYRLAEGAHVVEVQDPVSGRSWRKTVEITAAQVTVTTMGTE